MSSRPLLIALLCLAAAPAAAEEPLTAIPWLREAVRKPMPEAGPTITPLGMPEEINVAPIDGTNADAAGLVDAAGAGLPRDFWGDTPLEELARLMNLQRTDGLPAVTALLHRILVAELDPPVDSRPGGALFLARIDKLTDLGALEPALALIEREGAVEAASFSRWFDLALLTEQEDAVCKEMARRPGLSPELAARIFCLAREEDWPTAANSLAAGTILGTIPASEADLLTRFLEPELAETSAPLPPLSRPSPLDWRMLEAIGEPLSSNHLPLPFAQADLRANTGWKARLEAAERLAKSGALDPNVLHGLYTEQKAAASGGVWERVKAIQNLDAALQEADAGNAERLGLLLPQIWSRVVEAELEVPVSAIYAERLSRISLTGESQALLRRICLLHPANAQKVAIAGGTSDLTERFLDGLAKGSLRGLTPPDRMAGAIRDGFRSGSVPSDLQVMLGGNRKGEAVLHAMLRIGNGQNGDLRGVTEGIATLNAAGLEPVSRAVGLQLMLLERRG